jgi:hypothetical protein
VDFFFSNQLHKTMCLSSSNPSHHPSVLAAPYGDWKWISSAAPSNTDDGDDDGADDDYGGYYYGGGFNHLERYLFRTPPTPRALSLLVQHFSKFLPLSNRSSFGTHSYSGGFPTSYKTKKISMSPIGTCDCLDKSTDPSGDTPLIPNPYQ